MRGAEEARRELADYLTAHGVPTLDAWTEKDRAPAGKAVAAVSLRSCAGGPPGFQDYLGERYNAGTGRWEELYGKRVKLTFGLDLWAATAGEARRGLEALTAALGEGCPGGLRCLSFSAGETVWRADVKRYVCPAQAEFEAWSYAVAEEDGAFLDFTVRGEGA